MKRSRLFSSGLSATQRRVYGAVTVYYLLVSVALVWPVYPIFGSAGPLVLGMPFSLFYITTILVVSFGVLGALFLWERKNGRLGDSADSEEH